MSSSGSGIKPTTFAAQTLAAGQLCASVFLVLAIETSDGDAEVFQVTSRPAWVCAGPGDPSWRWDPAQLLKPSQQHDRLSGPHSSPEFLAAKPDFLQLPVFLFYGDE